MPDQMTAVSLFAGVGGFDLALQRAGVSVAAAVEIDPAARGVLADRFPDTTLFHDVREVTGDDLRAAGFDPRHGIITAGFPCQDLSVAGRRGGLGEGTRSGLFWQIVRLVADLRPAWLILENVPGLLSATCPCPGTGEHDGCGEPHTVPGGGCKGGCFPAHGGAMGLVLGALGDLGYGFAYRVLDAQHFGVPQRRRRVFVVGRAGGDPRGPVEVLLEPEGRGGDPAPGGQAGQVVAALTANGVGAGGGPDDNAAQAGHLVAAALTARQGKGPDSHATMTLVPVAFDAAQITSRTNRSNPRPSDPAPTLASGGYPHVAVPIALRGRDDGSNIEVGVPGDPAFTLRTPGGGSSYPMIAHTLTSEGHDVSEEGTGRGTPLVPMAFNPQTGGDMRLGYGETPTALTTNQITAVHTPPAVRRLTPLECERLQGFPDDWTTTSNGTVQADAPRYRQLGNAVAVPVAQWVTRRLVATDRATWEAAA